MKNSNLLGYSQQEYKKFHKHAWIVLLGFSILYSILYCGRQNLSYTMPVMMSDEGWTELELGILSSVLFWTYGMGHLINGRLGEIFGLNRFIVIGMLLSAITNILIGFQESLVMLAVLWGINGFFQSMLWSPGMALLANWWPSKHRGFATGIANAFSGMGQIFAAATVMLGFILLPDMGWSAGFVVPGIVMIIIAVIYVFICKDSPEKIGLKPYVDSDIKRNDQDNELRHIIAEKGKLYPYIYLFRQWRFDLWLLIIAGSSIARYGLLTWIPTYYVNEFGVDVKDGVLGTVLLPLGMAIGTLVIPWLSDKLFAQNRLPMVIICAAVSGVTVFMFMSVGPGLLAGALLFIAGFFIFAINGLVWAYATDVGGRAFSGTAAGILDCFAYIGAAFQSIYFGSVLTHSGDWNLVFMAIVVVCAVIIVAALLAGTNIKRKKTY